ncbi:atherin-like [Iris pallida]|uniref:Atherin-like n=1 Tax=Iris pallida TaxID=29817 RepID=A0AAX6GD70_IRIPA|nr:atherin-like [Iris pallida]
MLHEASVTVGALAVHIAQSGDGECGGRIWTPTTVAWCTAVCLP